MGTKDPLHAEATYRVIPLDDGAFAVEVSIPESYPAKVSPFATQADAEAYAGAVALRPQNQLAASAPRRPSAIRCLPWQPARRSRKSPLPARGLARTMSASLLPDTSGLAALRSATESSTPRSRRRRCNAPQSDTGINTAVARSATRSAGQTIVAGG